MVDASASADYNEQWKEIKELMEDLKETWDFMLTNVFHVIDSFRTVSKILTNQFWKTFSASKNWNHPNNSIIKIIENAEYFQSSDFLSTPLVTSAEHFIK